MASHGRFFSGYYLSTQNAPIALPPLTPTVTPPTPIALTTPTTPRDDFAVTTYDIVAVTSTKPRKILYIERGYIESISFFFGYYFDGSQWHTSESPLNTLAVEEKDSLYEYSNTIEATLHFGNTIIQISVPEIFTNMVVRSEREYIKFAGATTKEADFITIGDKPFISNVGLLKRYKKTFSATDVSNLQVTTDWMMFWDEQGNFYHLDKTNVGVKNEEYTPHEYFARTQYVGEDISGVLYLPVSWVTYTPHVSTISYSESGQTRNLDVIHSSKFYGKLYNPSETSNTLVTTPTGGIGVYTRFDTR